MKRRSFFGAFAALCCLPFAKKEVITLKGVPLAWNPEIESEDIVVWSKRRIAWEKRNESNREMEDIIQAINHRHAAAQRRVADDMEEGNWK